MPRIPELPTTTTRAPRVGISAAPQPLASGPPTDLLGAFGTTLSEIGRRMEEQKDTRQLNELQTQAIDRLDALKGEVLQDPNFETAVERYSRGSEEIKVDLTGQARNRRVRDSLSQSIGRSAILSQTQVRGIALKRSTEALQTSTDEMMGKQISTYASASTDTERFLAIGAAAAAHDNATTAGAFESQEAADKVWREFISDADRARALNLIQTRDFDAAAEFIEQSQILTDAEKISLENTRVAEQADARQEVLAVHAREVTDLFIGARRGQVSLDQAAAARDNMTNAQYASLVNIIDDGLKAGHNIQVMDARLDAALAGTGPPLPNTVEARATVDRRWARAKEIATTDGQVSVDELMEAGRELVSKSGSMGDQMKAETINWLRGDNPDTALSAANFMNDVIQQNGRLTDIFKPKERAFATLFANRVNSGMDVKRAFQAADAEVYKVDTIEQQTRTRLWKEGIDAGTSQFEEATLTAGAVRELFPTARTDPFGPDFLFGTMAEFEDLKTTYRDFVEAGFMLTGDINAAHALATQDVKTRWAVTNVDGNRRIMLNAPELLFSVGNRDSEWIREQFTTEMSGRMETGFAVQDIPDFDLSRLPVEDRPAFIEQRLSVIADPRSRRSEHPEYLVSILDDSGVAYPIYDADGEQLAWQPNYLSSPEEDRRAAEQAKIVAEAETRQKEIEATGRSGALGRVTADFRRAMGIPAEGLAEAQQTERLARERRPKGKPTAPTRPPVITEPGITEKLLDAVRWVESRGDPNAVSSTGAQGAYQVLPSTAAAPGFGVPPLKDPFDLVESRAWAKQYLNALLRRYDGNVDDAVRAYTWGAGNVDKWIASGRKSDVSAACPHCDLKYLDRIHGRLGVE